jgi:hypothetical protein
MAALLLLAAATTAPATASGCGGLPTARWTAPPAHTPTDRQVSVADGPTAGNGMLGIVTAPHRESWPLSPPNATALARQTVWIGSNSFWSANTYGADDAGASWVPPGGGPSIHCEVPYGMLAAGGVTVDFTVGPRAGEPGASYRATQDLCHATISTTVSSGSAGGAFHLSSVVLADDNVVLTNLSCATGCSAASAVVVDLWTHKGTAPFDQPTCGPDNMPRGGYVLPTSASVAAGSFGLVTRASAADGVNSAVLAPCGEYINDATQNFTLSSTGGGIALLDGRCLVRAGKSTAKGATGDKITVASCAHGGESSSTETSTAERWTLQKDGRLTSSQDGHCLSQVPGGAVYLEVVPCAPNSTIWRFQPSASSRSSAATGAAGAVSGGVLLAPSGQCLTPVEPSWIDDTALAMALVDAKSGQVLPSTPALVAVDDRRVRATVQLEPGQTITVVVASLTSFDVHGAAFASDPLRARRLARQHSSSSSIDPAVINATLSLLNSTVSRLGEDAPDEPVLEAHHRSWREFWNASSINITSSSSSSDYSLADLEGDPLDGPLALLEANYYGSQYILQSAGRILGTGHSGRDYPSVVGASSLFGPFATSDYLGWYDHCLLLFSTSHECIAIAHAWSNSCACVSAAQEQRRDLELQR